MSPKKKVGDMGKKKKSQQGIGSEAQFMPRRNPRTRKKPKKAPPGTKIGPGRKEKKGVPHGVDDDTIYLKKGGDVHPPKKKRGNYGPNIGKPFKAMGPVGGLPVNKAGTRIMAGVGKAGVGKLAGRLAKRGYGKAK